MDTENRPHFRTTSIGSNTTTTTATTSELFICFTSRLSSSSMKLSKSILSPGRAARGDGPVSLSSSLSRRLRNGSLKGGASPFFTTTGKKRGCGFDNPEPSSPKVTCIGQVRVKTKKKVKQTRSLSRRRSGEVSFRKIEQGGSGNLGADNEDRGHRYSNASAHYGQGQGQGQGEGHRNQRWVHLPVSICEALRAFGAEFSCLFPPCKSSCFSSGDDNNNLREKVEKRNGGCGGGGSGNENGCGAVFTRWFVSVNDGEGGKRREIELVVGGGDEIDEGKTEARVSMRSSRRHVFDDIEVKDGRIEVKGRSLDDFGDEEDDEGETVRRGSVCLPPKNALLLMRCRSDPMKMADLAHRFSWDASATNVIGVGKNENEGVREEIVCEGVEDFEQQIRRCEGRFEQDFVDVSVQDDGEVEQGEELVPNEGEVDKPEIREEELAVSSEGIVEEQGGEELAESELEMEIEVKNDEALMMENEEIKENEIKIEEEEEEEEVESNMSSFEALLEQENADQYEDCTSQEKELVDEENIPIRHLSPSSEDDEEEEEKVPEYNEAPQLPEEEVASRIETEESNTTFANKPEENQVTKTDRETVNQVDEESQDEETNAQQYPIFDEKPNKAKGNPVLPDCLLLMMCEPKLSMEVSKETWVCSTDFVRWLPDRPRKPAKGGTKPCGCDHEPVKRRLSIDSKPKPIIANVAKPKQKHLQQPPRSSCSLPAAAASMASMIEQKFVNAVGYEPFVLTRCKSEPMRTAAAKLKPESCFWNNNAVVSKMEPHRRAAVGVGAAGVGF